MSERPRKGELEATQQTIRFFETLLRASADGIVITDATQNIVVVNEAFCALFGRRWRDVAETSLFMWLEQLDAGASERWIELEQRVRREGLCRDVEFQMQRPEPVAGTTKDEVRYLSVNASLLERVADEEAGVIISIWHDITARVRAEEALRQYVADLEARNEELDAFAHTVAHDLKGPLGYMVGFARLLEEDYGTLPNEKRCDLLHTIAQSGHKMSNIIDELLLLARLRGAEVEMKPLDMASIVAEAWQRLVYMIEEYQAEIILPDAWPVALGHGAWIEEVWANYLSNALKYSGRPPRVELGFSIADLGFPILDSLPMPQPKGIQSKIENQKSKIVYWVRDNGPGLTPEEQARLFTPFTRLDQVRVKGHGLGLSIVRRIVEKLGGEVGVESQVGRGSLFWFTLPAQ